MDYNALWTEIQANAACTPHIVPAVPKVSYEVANAGDQAIADILNVGRKKAQHTEIGVGTILAAFGGLGGQFLDALEAAGQTNRDIHWLLQGTILRGVLDVGNPATRFGLQQLAVAMPAFADGINALLVMGEADDYITAADVSRAVRGPRE